MADVEAAFNTKSGLVGQRAEDWVEYTDDKTGKPYYYNKVTKATSWEKPKNLPTQPSPTVVLPNNASSVQGTQEDSSDSGDDEVAPPGVEPDQGDENQNENESDSEDDKEEPPQKVQENKPDNNNTTTANNSQPETTETKDTNSVDAESPESLISKRLPSVTPAAVVTQALVPVLLSQSANKQYNNKRERKAAFRELLESSNIDPELSWNDAMKKIINDPRYQALKTVGERKAVYTEYCDKKRRTNRERALLERRQARENFMTLLSEHPEITSRTRYRKITDSLEKDKRFAAVQDDADRENLFHDYTANLERKEREHMQQQKQNQMDDFRQLLESMDLIKSGTLWRKVQDLCENDSRYKVLEKKERHRVFEEFIKDKKRREEEEKLRDREARKRQERKCREDFRQFLKQLGEEDELDHRTRWKDFQSKYRNNEIFIAVQKQGDGHHMFDDFVEEARKIYKDNRRTYVQILQSSNFDVNRDTALVDFSKCIWKGLQDELKEVISDSTKDNSMEVDKEAKQNEESQPDTKTQKMIQMVYDEYMQRLEAALNVQQGKDGSTGSGGNGREPGDLSPEPFRDDLKRHKSSSPSPTTAAKGWVAGPPSASSFASARDGEGNISPRLKRPRTAHGKVWEPPDTFISHLNPDMAKGDKGKMEGMMHNKHHKGGVGIDMRDGNRRGDKPDKKGGKQIESTNQNPHNPYAPGGATWQEVEKRELEGNPLRGGQRFMRDAPTAFARQEYRRNGWGGRGGRGGGGRASVAYHEPHRRTADKPADSRPVVDTVVIEDEVVEKKKEPTPPPIDDGMQVVTDFKLPGMDDDAELEDQRAQLLAALLGK